MSLLIVEDNTISLRMLEVMLVSNGFEVVTAKSGRQALERLADRDDIQMVLTDLMMPEVDGMRLLEEMRGDPRLSAMPVLVVSSLSDAETVRRVVQLGCRNYLVKPLKEEVLIPKIRALLVGVPAPVRHGPLRAKFDVLRDSGLDVEQFEALFDAFFAQAREAASTLATATSISPGDALGAAVLALRDGAATLATGRLSGLVDKFRETGACDLSELGAALGEVIAAMEAAIEKRNRVRQKIEQGEAPAA